MVDTTPHIIHHCGHFIIVLFTCVCVVARREVGAQTPAAGDPRVGGARKNQDIRARSKRARRLQAQVPVEGGERREGI